MTNIAARARNLAKLLEQLLVGGTMTRAELAAETGLSKATVARLVTELDLAGLVETRAIDPAGGPGRRSTGLGVPSSTGHVIGLSFGLRSSHAVALDLSGRVVGTRLEPTPAFDDTAAATSWAVDFLSGLERSLRDRGVPLRLCVALPGRVRDGLPISALPAPLSVLSGGSLATELEEAFGATAMLETDADMSLAGVTSLGHLDADAAAVLFALSTALTVSTRTHRGLVQARTPAFGDYAALPVTISDPLDGTSVISAGSLLSVRGITDYAASRGLALESTSELWESEDPAIVRVRQAFTGALESAILVAAITTDPEVCVLTGRLAPLASRVISELRERLGQRLSKPPTLLVPGAEDNGLTTALGSAQTALALERTAFVARVRDSQAS